ncbi:MAG TPA: hypothetical protein VEK57_21805 [Thermoanaerobaculia bacterium]|nr:hypothetical protein [Thermoanaerobaculia bacterium]
MRKAMILAAAILATACTKQYDSSYDTGVAQPAYRGEHPRILVDQAHHNRHDVDGTYKPFATLLKNDGYAVETLTGPVTAAALSGADLFVIPSALGTDDTNTEAAFTETEAGVLEAWVRGGGALLLITDHYPFGIAVGNLAQRFGVEMHGGMTFDPVHHDKSSGDDSQLLFSRENRLLADHPITAGRGGSERVGRILTFTGQSLRAPHGTSLLRLSSTAVHRAANPKVTRSGSDVVVTVEFGPPTSAAGWSQAIALRHGRGRVLILGEAAMISAQRDGDRRIGINTSGTDGRQFLLNAAHWLTGMLPAQG